MASHYEGMRSQTVGWGSRPHRRGHARGRWRVFAPLAQIGCFREAIFLIPLPAVSAGTLLLPTTC
eukprot:6173454-Pleurochrysis_carterae.AAC.2